MGIVYAEVALQNLKDVISAEIGLIKNEEIRQTSVTAIVDTGAGTMIINEELRQKLGLELKEPKQVELADGSKHVCNYTDHVYIHWKDRTATCKPILVPTANDALLGALPLEEMDLIIHPAKLELTGAHGDEAVMRV